MAASLPYVSSPGTIDNAFKKIKDAATPPRFTLDFVNTVLQIKGGAGNAIPPFLKKLGFLNADGTPSALYDRFRNDATSKAAVGEGMRAAYKPLFDANEYAYSLNDTDLKGLIVQVTGAKKDDRVAELIYGTFKRLKTHASFEPLTLPAERDEREPPPAERTAVHTGTRHPRSEGIGLSYTITLNLPASTNIEVFNAIFKSLRENLLRD